MNGFSSGGKTRLGHAFCCLVLLPGVLLTAMRSVSAQSFDSSTVPTPPYASGSFEVSGVILQVHEQLSLAMPSSGTIGELLTQEGALVENGQKLLVLESQREKLEIERLRGELAVISKQAASRVEIEYADKVIAVAETELSRAHESNQGFPGLVSENELNKLQLVVERSLADRAKSQFNLEILAMNQAVKEVELRRSEVDLERRTLRSPVRGRIEQVDRKAGEWLDIGQSAMRLVRLDYLRAEVKVPGELLAEGLESRGVTFEANATWLKERVFRGRIGFVESQVSPVDGTVRVWALIENPMLTLLPGVSGKLTLLPLEKSPGK